jgi:hypothetical protein
MTIASLGPAFVPPANAPRIEVRLVGYNQFEVVRHEDDEKHHERHGRHEPHAPATRTMPTTIAVGSSSTSGSIATADLLEYAPGAASDQIVDGLKFFYARSVRPMIYRY